MSDTLALTGRYTAYGSTAPIHFNPIIPKGALCHTMRHKRGKAGQSGANDISMLISGGDEQPTMAAPTSRYGLIFTTLNQPAHSNILISESVVTKVKGSFNSLIRFYLSTQPPSEWMSVRERMPLI